MSGVIEDANGSQNVLVVLCFLTNKHLPAFLDAHIDSMQLLCIQNPARHGAALQFKPGDRVFAMIDGANVRNTKGNTADYYSNIAFLHVHVRLCAVTALHL